MHSPCNISKVPHGPQSIHPLSIYLYWLVLMKDQYNIGLYTHRRAGAYPGGGGEGALLGECLSGRGDKCMARLDGFRSIIGCRHGRKPPLTHSRTHSHTPPPIHSVTRPLLIAHRALPAHLLLPLDHTVKVHKNSVNIDILLQYTYQALPVWGSN